MSERVTEEMVEAGLPQLLVSWHPDTTEHRKGIVRAILTAALAARPASAYGSDHDAIVRVLQTSPDLIVDGAVANTSAVALRILDAIARPASAEPVAWAIREADGKWTSGNTYRTEERASRMVRALTSEGAHGLRVFPLYTTPPAAAQDRERLDWLEAKGEDWTCRESGVGRGWRLHQSFSGERDTYVSPRAAIDAAMNAANAAGATDAD